MSHLPDLTAVLAVLDGVPRDVVRYRGVSDSDLLELTRVVAEVRKVADAHAALCAGEVARRSAPELGSRGLAQRAGHRTVEEFVRVTAKASGRDAVATVRAGRILHGDSAAGAGLAPVGVAVLTGAVNVAQADSIRAGLGDVSPEVPVEVLTQAAGVLCDEARDLDPDRLRKRAAQLRDEIDAAGIHDREAAKRAQRSFRRIQLPDGMRKYIWVADPETATIIDDVYDRATSPRRGGPRFVDPDQREAARRVAEDDRTTEQIASDAFTELLRQAGTLDTQVLLGAGAPVRVLVPVDQLENRTGHGYLESTQEPVSIHTVERLACANGTQPYVIDPLGQVLDLGREQRLYTKRQREALAVRDGGCMWPGCDRPPSWTEAHHTRHWARDGGRTDLADGILLCRHHHLKLHNENWNITQRSGRYWLEPPPGTSKPGHLLETKSRAIRDHHTRTG